ncbi:MAG: hypoxanthine phosphoribosyltransferase [Saprospiraceae bacterium]
MNQTYAAHDLLFKIMISEAEIQERIREMGVALTAKYQDKNPLFVGVLNGAFIFTADLMRACSLACEVDFVRISSYAGLQSTGKIDLIMELKTEIKDRHVIIVEDIIDTGKTLHYFIQELQKREPASVAIAALLLKPEALEYPMDIDFLGFEIPTKFVIGYGLDYDEQGRHLNAIYQLVENE